MNWDLVAAELAKQTTALIEKKIGRVVDRIAALEAKQAELLERQAAVERRGISYNGVWARSASYDRGCLVTCDGGLWLGAVDHPTSKPGTDAEWQLVAKGGKA